MKTVAAFCLLLVMTGAAFADSNATGLKIKDGKFIVAQSYCGMCADNASACRIKCNGAGTCIQACDDDYRLCVEQNCRRRY
jgi:hypothetical protein